MPCTSSIMQHFSVMVSLTCSLKSTARQEAIPCLLKFWKGHFHSMLPTIPCTIQAKLMQDFFLSFWTQMLQPAQIETNSLMQKGWPSQLARIAKFHQKGSNLAKAKGTSFLLSSKMVTAAFLPQRAFTHIFPITNPWQMLKPHHATFNAAEFKHFFCHVEGHCLAVETVLHCRF